MNDIKLLNRAADNIRILSAAMVEKAKSGHPGGAMGGADFINVLYSEFLTFDPDRPTWENRDRFFLDPGHMSPMLYSQLALIGNLNMDDIRSFRQWGSRTPGHPEVNFELGVENTSGPLGQGHTMAVGAAIAERFLAARFGEWTKHKIYTFISDGGIQEEISQGAGRIAGLLGLSNLIMYYDSNDVQLSTFVNEVTSEDTAMKYQAWGWNVITINGNDAAEIRAALKNANEETERPTLIIGKTIMGKGAMGPNGESFENKVSTHGQPLGAAGASIANTITNLGGDAENPFVIFPEVAEMYENRKNELRKIVAARHAEQAEWEAANPALAKKFHDFYNKNLPDIDYAAIEQKADQATRSASGSMLALFSEKIENMVVSSADLSNSDALIILTDIDGYYDSDPKQNEDARLVCRVKEITTEMIEAAGGTGSNRGTGGMHTKLEAALFATNRGIAVNVMSGDNPALLYDLFDGHSVGTFFEPKAK